MDRLHVINGGLPKTEEGAKLLAMPITAAAFQWIVEPSGRWYLELFGHVIDGGQRPLFLVVRKPAFQLEKLRQHGEAQPLLCALI